QFQCSFTKRGIDKKTLRTQTRPRFLLWSINENVRMKKQKLPRLFLITFLLVACNNNDHKVTNENSEMKTDNTRSNMVEKKFGDYNGQTVMEYTIANTSGMQVSILNYGGIITKLLVPDKNGKTGDVVLGFSSFDGYLQKNNP